MPIWLLRLLSVGLIDSQKKISIMAYFIAVFSWGDLDPHLTHDPLGPSEPTNQTASPSVSCFCTDDRRVSLYFTMGRPFPPQNCPFPWGDLDTI